jgi:hypothetical protein
MTTLPSTSIVDGTPMTPGDLRVLPIAVPGDTPASMAFVFAVTDNGHRDVGASNLARRGIGQSVHSWRRPCRIIGRTFRSLQCAMNDPRRTAEHHGDD